MNKIGRLAVLKHVESVYVVWNYYESSDLYLLVELDRPSDGEQAVVKENEFRLLKPLEIVERVIQWK
jgi:hypothetical protein